MSTTQDHEPKGSIKVEVRDAGPGQYPIANAQVGLYKARELLHGDAPKPDDPWHRIARSNDKGELSFDGLLRDVYYLAFLHEPSLLPVKVDLSNVDVTDTQHLRPLVDATVTTKVLLRNGRYQDARSPQVGDRLVATVRCAKGIDPTFSLPPGWDEEPTEAGAPAEFSAVMQRPGPSTTTIDMLLPPIGRAGRTSGDQNAILRLSFSSDVAGLPTQPVSGQLGVALTRTETEPTEDLPLWLGIRNGTEALSFNRYLRFMDVLFGHRGHRRNGGARGFDAESDAFEKLQAKRFLPFNDSDSYRVLKAATEAFVMVNCGVLQPDDPDDDAHRPRDKAFHPRRDNAYLDRRDLPAFDNPRGSFEDYLEGRDRLLPYLALVARKLPDIPIVEGDPDGANLAVGFVHDKLASPCLVELIWSYWHEEAMLVQTMNAVTRRFQNRAAPNSPDPLANLEIDPLRPLNSLLWGYTQDEQHRLTVNRRNAEYDHQYGLRLRGKAVKDYRVADSRSQFLEGFHHLLRLLTTFYKQDDDTTVKADAFPVLNALKEVHLVMSQGAHNNFGELATTARIEMLMQQWLLGRPEFREFLPSRIMVAYPEPWMDRVDAMKKLQGWTDTSVVHFRNLAIFGEQVMLSIRFGAWSEVYEPTQAFNWARFWRPQVQGYIHAYRAATGIDLGSETFDPSADATLPSLLMQRRLAQQQRNA